MASFDFLAAIDKKIADSANEAEQKAAEDAEYSLFKLRTWLERVLKFLDTHHNIPPIRRGEIPNGQGENEYRINRLKDFGVSISRWEIDQLDAVRMSSNKAAHADEHLGFFTESNAREAIEEARKVSKWLEREYGKKQRKYSPVGATKVLKPRQATRNDVSPIVDTLKQASRSSVAPASGTLQQTITSRRGLRAPASAQSSRTATPRNSAGQGAVAFGVLILVALGAIGLMGEGDQSKTPPPVPKAPVTIASILDEMGLRGTFAMDCARRPSPANAYRRFIFEQPLPKLIEDGPRNSYSGAPTDTWVVMQAKNLAAIAGGA